MATNEIQGDLVGLFISTVLVSPLTTDFKEVVCAENSGLDGSADVNTRRTKCGVVKGVGPMGWTVTGTGTNNSAPGTNQISANTLVSLAQNQTPVLVKMVHATTSSLYTRIGQGIISRYAESANAGDPLGFDFTIDISGNMTLS
jgi:hypothetical protein